MVYWPGAASTWNAAQKVHMVWAVQGLTDQCDAVHLPDKDLEAYQDKTDDEPDATQDDYDEAYDAHCAKRAPHGRRAARGADVRRRLVPGRA